MAASRLPLPTAAPPPAMEAALLNMERRVQVLEATVMGLM
jgi:hypothetical protein